jgi:hypothetical protein
MVKTKDRPVKMRFHFYENPKKQLYRIWQGIFNSILRLAVMILQVVVKWLSILTR